MLLVTVKMMRTNRLKVLNDSDKTLYLANRVLRNIALPIHVYHTNMKYHTE